MAFEPFSNVVMQVFASLLERYIYGARSGQRLEIVKIYIIETSNFSVWIIITMPYLNLHLEYSYKRLIHVGFTKKKTHRRVFRKIQFYRALKPFKGGGIHDALNWFPQ